MSPLPTMSLRCPPEYQPLIRDIARALRTRPDLADALAALVAEGAPASVAPSPALAQLAARLEAVEQWIAERNTDALRSDTAPAIAPTTTAEDDFPARMQAARKAKGWTTRQLAAEAGISQTVVSHVESRRATGSPESRAKIAAALEMGGV